MDRQSKDFLGSAFSALLAGTFVTNLGDGLRLAALPLLATTLTKSPLLISGVTAAQFLPWTTFAPFGGVIVDRSDRRLLIMITQTWRAFVMAILAVAVFFEAASIWHLFAVAFLITVGEILVDPSVVATLPTLVSRTDLDRANGRLTTVEIVTNEFVGGPLGAMSFALAPWLPFLLDALSYGASTVPFGRLPASARRTNQARTTPHQLGSEMGIGLRWIWDHEFLRPLTLAVALFHLGTAGAFSLLVLLVTKTLGASELVFGVVLSASAVGATLASLVAAELTQRMPRRTVITSAAMAASLSVVAAGAAREPWQLVVAWVLNGAAGAVLLSIGRGFVQRHTPNDRLGRTAIASRMITRTSFVVGSLLAGAIANWTSVRWSFVVAGSLHLLGAAGLRRAFRHEPNDQQHLPS